MSKFIWFCTMRLKKLCMCPKDTETTLLIILQKRLMNVVSSKPILSVLLENDQNYAELYQNDVILLT